MALGLELRANRPGALRKPAVTHAIPTTLRKNFISCAVRKPVI